jgi:hypothetical protein
MFNWIKSLFAAKPVPKKRVKKEKPDFELPNNDFMVWDNKSGTVKGIDKIPAKRPRLYKQAVVVTKGELPKPARKAPVKKAPVKKVAVKKPVTKAKK